MPTGIAERAYCSPKFMEHPSVRPQSFAHWADISRHNGAEPEVNPLSLLTYKTRRKLFPAWHLRAVIGRHYRVIDLKTVILEPQLNCCLATLSSPK